MILMNGLLVLVSAPSGGGKNAVIRALLKRVPDATQLVTTTTRQRRSGEIHGKDYYFISRDAFEKKISNGELVEWNEYAKNLYGTEWKELRERRARYSVVLSQAEVNGKKNLDRLHIPHLSFFLLPENFDVLKRRIRARGGVSEAVLDRRLAIARNEIEASEAYDYRIANKEGKMIETVAEIEGIIRERLAQKREG